MQDQPLFVFAQAETGVPLRILLDALRRARLPVGIGIEIAGDAIDAQLDDPLWETAFVRWKEPELHDVWLLERAVVGTDEEADHAITGALRFANNHVESGDKLIVADHLRKTRMVYTFVILPAMLEDEDHPAWPALDIALRTLAEHGDDLIYAEGEAFYDADGEPMLGEEEE